MLDWNVFEIGIISESGLPTRFHYLEIRVSQPGAHEGQTSDILILPKWN